MVTAQAQDSDYRGPDCYLVICSSYTCGGYNLQGHAPAGLTESGCELESTDCLLSVS